MIKRPTTPEAYVDLVQQAVFEVSELRSSLEYDADGMERTIACIDDLEKSVKAVYAAMVDGSYEFADKDLPFMEIVKGSDDTFLPFRDLLSVNNDTHRNGLEVD
jgi:hypothetical protein